MAEISENPERRALKKHFHRIERIGLLQARLTIRAVLLGVGAHSEQAEAVQLVLEEILTSAYKHAVGVDLRDFENEPPPLGVVLKVEVTGDGPARALRMEVHDRNSTLPDLLSADAEPSQFKGDLPLTCWYANRYGAQLTETGKFVWVEFDLRPEDTY